MNKFVELTSISDLLTNRNGVKEKVVEQGETYYTWADDYYDSKWREPMIDIFKSTFYDDPTTIGWIIAYNKNYCGLFYKKFFISKAQWRNQQIDSILDV
jgi:hypothetical protein